MKRPSVKFALIGAIAGLCALAAFLAYMSISAINSVAFSTREIVEDAMPGIAASKDLNTGLSDLQVAYANHIISIDATAIAAADKVIDARKATLEQDLAAYARLIHGDAVEQGRYETLRKLFVELAAQGDKVAELSRANINDKAKELYDKSFMPVVNRIGDVADEIEKINAEAAARSSANVEDMTARGLLLVYTVGAVVVGLGLAAILFAVTGIANPIVRITDAMRKLADGDTASDIPFAGRSDEIGTMAGAVEVFRRAAIANKRLEEEAEIARGRAERDRIAAQERAEADAAERLRIATSGLAGGLRRLASGDLAFQLTEAFAPDFEALRHDFNQSVRQLGETLSMISESIGTIDGGTREISVGANDLSRRTEQQAAALEQTAAALDEITANVSNSTKRTDEARTVAAKANQNAVNSTGVVNHAEEAMRRIEASSRQISNIIGVIDEIAFQTNLLALNAGVEAARAGEAGKGFAVVAQEVRELAQRSAQAAKEIKELIRNSAGEVENGVALVRDAGTALGTICGFIAEINQHMDAIAVSAKEQSTGLGEVNSAVNAMDQTTQQNAAMVEESTAASASLAMEAQKLRELVSRFRLDGGMPASQASGHAGALRQVASAMAAPVSSRPQPKIVASAGAGGASDWEEF
ncbi:methyl-accepting chemotaxis protein [Rhizobium puerariae]|uniref:Methyl-accepting chemotaxis protein n=1 Tax=Rhizobium puerariae TaxID=1585791 RepID=A0ABV6ALF9_9HYPH